MADTERHTTAAPLSTADTIAERSYVYSVLFEKLDDCIDLETGTCMTAITYSPATGPQNDYHFVQEVPYWCLITLTNPPTANAGMGAYTECDGEGTLLANSAWGYGGSTDLIVGDFNHNPPGDYYLHTGSYQMDVPFTLLVESGPDVFQVPGEISGHVGGANCDQGLIWDLYLEQGKTYEFWLYEYGDAEPHLALFRNPGTGVHWDNRPDAEFELGATIGPGSYIYTYTAPQTDYYGLAVFAETHGAASSLYQTRVEELNDCQPLTREDCVSNFGWPRDYSFEVTAPYWAVIGVLKEPEDSKNLYIRSQCDGNGTLIASDASGLGQTGFVVGDFNHNQMGTYYARVAIGGANDYFTTLFDHGTSGADMFPVGSYVTGSLGGTTGDCGAVEIWDVYLEAGTEYIFGFSRSGHADIRLELFHNPGSGTYWTFNGGGDLQMLQPGNAVYGAPATDWYGLVVYADNINEIGTYTIAINGVSPGTGIDPTPVLPDRFALYQNTPNPFNPSTTIRFDVPAAGGHVDLRIYDVSGRLVRTLVDGTVPAGEQSVVWDGRDNRGAHVTAGVYFYRLLAPGFTETRKLVLVK
ncbi:MAG: T9SS type A sorting domain-containing protein [Candidatus Latescibacterota bacterium]|nr:MAG: T9SS type A sorting domain-containing protein [Candidatus Latescibacterota bacterium]